MFSKNPESWCSYFWPKENVGLLDCHQKLGVLGDRALTSGSPSVVSLSSDFLLRLLSTLTHRQTSFVLLNVCLLLTFMNITPFSPFPRVSKILCETWHHLLHWLQNSGLYPTTRLLKLFNKEANPPRDVRFWLWISQIVISGQGYRISASSRQTCK